VAELRYSFMVEARVIKEYGTLVSPSRCPPSLAWPARLRML
jgi:hypothetical protein